MTFTCIIKIFKWPPKQRLLLKWFCPKTICNKNICPEEITKKYVVTSSKNNTYNVYFHKVFNTIITTVSLKFTASLSIYFQMCHILKDDFKYYSVSTIMSITGKIKRLKYILYSDLSTHSIFKI